MRAALLYSSFMTAPQHLSRSGIMQWLCIVTSSGSESPKDDNLPKCEICDAVMIVIGILPKTELSQRQTIFLCTNCDHVMRVEG